MVDIWLRLWATCIVICLISSFGVHVSEEDEWWCGLFVYLWIGSVVGFLVSFLGWVWTV